MSTAVPAHVEQFLYRCGLARIGESASWTALSGGVSSEIWRVDLPGRSICVKRALGRLKVAAEWEAPLSRNEYEWRWLNYALAQQPLAVPRPLAHDPEAGLFAMSFLSPDMYPNWKSQLLAGVIETNVAAKVGATLARLHAASVGRQDLMKEFDSIRNFHALRLEPYFIATATRHADLKKELNEIVDSVSAASLALVHGDVSPKNILLGPDGPVFLDAECAWYGDPAFDVAFCVNHLFLKSLVMHTAAKQLVNCIQIFLESYFEIATFEARSGVEERIAHLLPALMLSRVDGKSPVEYLINRPAEQDAVRRVARSVLRAPQIRVADIAKRWLEEIDKLKASDSD